MCLQFPSAKDGTNYNLMLTQQRKREGGKSGERTSVCA